MYDLGVRQRMPELYTELPRAMEKSRRTRSLEKSRREGPHAIKMVPLAKPQSLTSGA